MHNTDKMKKSELHKIVREAIQEVINESTAMVTTKAGTKSISFKNTQELDPLKRDPNVSSIEDTTGKKIKEVDLDELANVAVMYTLAPDVNAADYTGKKARIIAAMQETGEPMSKTGVATAMGYDKQNPINADFMALVAAGVINQAEQQAAPRLTRPAAAAEPGEEAPPAEDEFGLSGREDISDEEIDAMFAAAARAGEEEPEATDVEKADTGSVTMSDKDYEDFMAYSDLADRLARVKSDILKSKRSKGGVAGDIADTSKGEVERLVALKNKLQQRIDDLVAGSEYLQRRQAAKAAPEEETGNEETLDEWMKNRWQVRAGIKK